MFLYKKNGDERYPNFRLYKMIARTVHNHTPEQQFELPIFQKFIILDNITTIKSNIIDLDSVVCYA